jgi:hypothetical protein
MTKNKIELESGCCTVGLQQDPSDWNKIANWRNRQLSGKNIG